MLQGILVRQPCIEGRKCLRLLILTNYALEHLIAIHCFMFFLNTTFVKVYWLPTEKKINDPNFLKPQNCPPSIVSLKV